MDCGNSTVSRSGNSGSNSGNPGPSVGWVPLRSSSLMELDVLSGSGERSEQIERRELARGRPHERFAPAGLASIVTARRQIGAHVLRQALYLRLHIEHPSSHL